MPMTREPNAVRLDFQTKSAAHTDLSGIAFSGPDWMWVAGDESAAIERLKRLAPTDGARLHFGDAQTFPLAELLDLPGGPGDEADLEGLAVDDGWLWLVGSHGHKRKKPKDGERDDKNIRRLAKLELDGNRRLLARVPIETDDRGEPRLVREARDGRRAARLDGDAEDNALTTLLRDDPHIAPFLAIPGKDNGLDIEGLALLGPRALLGLRGPVLRGWAMLLEIAPEPDGRRLRLAPLDADGTRLRKHFVELDGFGVRDLHVDGDDLYLLGGPTMVLDGDVRLFRWAGARQALAAGAPLLRGRSTFTDRTDLPHGPGQDRAEAFCALPPGLLDGGPAWLVLYDAPGPARRAGTDSVFGDLLRPA